MSNRPTIENLLPRDELLGFSRRQSRAYVRQTVKFAEVETMAAAGWDTQRTNKSSVSMVRPKTKPALLESRVWSVLYRMGFGHLSEEGGAKLVLRPNDSKSPLHQIDVVVVDDEIALAIECKSYKTPKKDPKFAEKLARHSGVRGRFADAIQDGFPGEEKRQVATVMFTWDLIARETDTKRAEDEKVLLLDEQDLEYYEDLVKHLGPGARFQFLAEAFRGRTIRGLEIRVPALCTKMGPLVCYTFSVRPDYLLKVAYISHRAKGKAFDVDSYQRMLRKSRLKRIGEFITDDGIFPTNIVVNIEDRRQLRFDRGRQEGTDSDTGGLFGWLTLSPTYGSAWIIDGQHRLFAYSGHLRASTSYLNVLAFEALSASKQTELFVDINSEQRRVTRSLLIELDATLKWDSEDESKRQNAIISKAAMALGEVAESPLRERVLLADGRRTNRRCVSLTAIAGALTKSRLLIATRRKGYPEYGPLWREDPDQCLRRTVRVVAAWLMEIADEARDWWDLGAEEGGGLAMNDGITVCLNMLRSVVDHLNVNDSLGPMDDGELAVRLRPFAQAVGGYFARTSPEERVRLRRGLRGVEGQHTGTRLCQADLQGEFPKYQPEGLSDWLKRRDANTNERARSIIDKIEVAVQDRILNVLKEEFDHDDEAWWYEGIPKSIRLKVSERIEDAGGGKREAYFDLIHYEVIIKGKWLLLKDTFAYGESKNISKEKGTAWLREIAGWRNKVMHSSRGDYLGLDELDKLQDYHKWLTEQLSKAPEGL